MTLLDGGVEQTLSSAAALSQPSAPQPAQCSPAGSVKTPSIDGLAPGLLTQAHLALTHILGSCLSELPARSPKHHVRRGSPF